MKNSAFTTDATALFNKRLCAEGINLFTLKKTIKNLSECLDGHSPYNVEVTHNELHSHMLRVDEYKRNGNKLELIYSDCNGEIVFTYQCKNGKWYYIEYWSELDQHNARQGLPNLYPGVRRDVAIRMGLDLSNTFHEAFDWVLWNWD